MQRDTTQFTIEKTAHGSEHVVVLNSYLTEREKRVIQTAYATEVDKAKETVGSLLIYEKLQDLTLQAVVVSIDGIKEGEPTSSGTALSVVDFVLNLPSEQFKSLYAKVKEIADGEKKTTS